MKRWRFFAIPVAGILCLCFISSPGRAQETPDAREDFRVNQGLLQGALFDRADLSYAQLKAEISLLSRVPGTIIGFHPAFKRPGYIFNRTKNLTPPSADTPENVCRAFLKDYAGLYELTEDDLLSLQLTHEYETKHNGVKHLFLAQQVEGVPLDGSIHFNLSKNGQIISVSGGVISDLKSSVNATEPEISAPEAVKRAAADVGIQLAGGLKVVSQQYKNPRETVLSGGASLSRDVKAGLVYFQLNETTCLLAWKFSLSNFPLEKAKAEKPVACAFLVDALTGKVLSRHSLIRNVEPVRWLVFTEEGPRPMEFEPEDPAPNFLSLLPGRGEPETDPVSNTRREVVDCAGGVKCNGDYELDEEGNPLLVNGEGEPIASPLGWIPDGVTTTSGNNVEAMRFDRNGEHHQPQAEADQDGIRNFFYPLDFGREPEHSEDAAIANVCYWINFMHDYFYKLGFDEGAGNLQSDNFGRGGLGGDPLTVYMVYRDDLVNRGGDIVETPDGQSMVMGITKFNRNLEEGEPAVDGAYDQAVIIHEYTHALSSRLVGGPNIVGLQSGKSEEGGLSEGWSDWFVLSILSRPEDPVDGTYPLGCYAAQDFRFGLRRYPYSTDMDINPLSYRHMRIDPTREDRNLDIDFNRNLPASYEPWAKHNAGEIWCAVLWEAHANFIERYCEWDGERWVGFEEAKRKLQQLVVDGMKLAPALPTFVNARDFILLADRVNNDGENQDILWRAFAKRGLGYGADDKGGTFNINVEESYVDPMTSDGSLILDYHYSGEEDGRLEISLLDGELAEAGVDTVAVSVSTSGAEDNESVLLEKIADEGFFLFTGSIRVVFEDAAAIDDGALQAVDFDTATVAYRHRAFQPDEIQESIVVARRPVALGRYVADGNIPVLSFALADIDYDNRAEIYVCGPGKLLKIQEGVFEDKTGRNRFGSGNRHACWADYDNDGDVDLLTAGLSGPLLFRNRGIGTRGRFRFSDITEGAGLGEDLDRNVYSGSWVDFDNDGHLDLIGAFGLGAPGRPYLYRNDGDRTFSRIEPQALGLGHDIRSPHHKTNDITLADIDKDGYLDVLLEKLVNRRKCLLRNDDGDGLELVFEFEHDREAYYSSWADFNNDGDFDLLLDSLEGNKLFRNNGDLTFGDITEAAGLEVDPGFFHPRRSAWVDYDNDGFLDLIVTGRYTFAPDNRGALYFYKNNGDETFTEIAAELGMEEVDAGCVAVGNVDGDLMPELLIGEGNEVAVYKFPPTGNNFLCVKAGVVVGDIGRAAIGARIEVDLDNDGDFSPDALLTRQIEGYGQNQMIAHFGLGAAEEVDVRVTFPGGAVQSRDDVGANQLIVINDPDRNVPPQFFPIGKQRVRVGERLSFTVRAHDFDVDELAYSADRRELPRGAVFDPAEARFTWTPADDQGREAPYWVRFFVEDGRGGEDSDFVLIDVESDNQPPVFEEIGPQQAAEGEELTFVVHANDPDGDRVTYGTGGIPRGAVFDPEEGRFTWTPTHDQGRENPYSVKFFAKDGRGGWDSLIVSIEVRNTMNSPPVFEEIGVQSGFPAELLTFTIRAIDPDGDEVTYAPLDIPDWAILDGRSGTFSWVPAEDQVGKYIAQFEARDGRGGEDRLSVRVVVMPPPPPRREILF